MREPYIGDVMTRRTPGPRNEMVSTGPVIEHINTLMDIGMTMAMVARAAGVSDEMIRLIAAGEQRTTRRSYADAIRVVDGRPMKHQALVLGVGTRRRLQGLAATGWSLRMIGDRLGVNQTRVSMIRRAPLVSWGTYLRVKVVFDSLGPDGGSVLSLRQAAREGWVHPFLWDDIDDPFEVPVVPDESGVPDPVVVDRLVAGRSVVAASKAERLEAWRVLREQGLAVGEIARRMDVAPRTVGRYNSELAVAS